MTMENKFANYEQEHDAERLHQVRVELIRLREELRNIGARVDSIVSRCRQIQSNAVATPRQKLAAGELLAQALRIAKLNWN